YVLRLTACDQGTLPSSCTGLSASDDVTITTSGSLAAALVTIDGTANDPDDALVKARLEGLGFTVTPADDSANAGTVAAGKALIVISSDCDSRILGNKYKNIAVPIVTWEHLGYGLIAMTGPTSDVDYGTVDGQTQLTIVNATHPLAAGLSGTVGVVV